MEVSLFFFPDIFFSPRPPTLFFFNQSTITLTFFISAVNRYVLQTASHFLHYCEIRSPLRRQVPVPSSSPCVTTVLYLLLVVTL